MLASVTTAVALAAPPVARAEWTCEAPLDDSPPATRWTSDPARAPSAWLEPCRVALASAPRPHQRAARKAALPSLVMTVQQEVILLHRDADALDHLARASALPDRDAAGTSARSHALRVMGPAVEAARHACTTYAAAPSRAALAAMMSALADARLDLLRRRALADALDRGLRDRFAQPARR